jgi:hypothetical protein
MATNNLIDYTALRAKVKEVESSGGSGGGMDITTRIERLEGSVKQIETDIKSLVKEVHEIKGRVSQLPTFVQVIGLVFAIFGAAFALLRFGIPH